MEKNTGTEYNLDELASRIEFDREDYIPLLSLFVEQTLLDLEEIQRYLPKGNEKVISERIHNITGAALNLGLDKIADILASASALNHAFKHSDMVSIIDKCVKEADTLKRLLE